MGISLMIFFVINIYEFCLFYSNITLIRPRVARNTVNFNSLAPNFRGLILTVAAMLVFLCKKKTTIKAYEIALFFKLLRRKNVEQFLSVMVSKICQHHLSEIFHCIAMDNQSIFTKWKKKKSLSLNTLISSEVKTFQFQTKIINHKINFGWKCPQNICIVCRLNLSTLKRQ